MTKIYVTRHGETQWNTLRRMQGHLDSPLTEMGEKQANWLAERLKNVQIDHIYSSPAGRALQTAEIVNQYKNLEIKTRDHLKEIYLGEWEGLTQPEIEAIDAQEYEHFWYKPECYKAKTGESFEEVIIRTSIELERIAEKHAGETVLLVAHAVVLKSLYAYIEQKPLEDFWKGPFMNSTCLSCFEKTKEGWQITMAADTSHYPEDVKPQWVHPK